MMTTMILSIEYLPLLPPQYPTTTTEHTNQTRNNRFHRIIKRTEHYPSLLIPQRALSGTANGFSDDDDEEPHDERDGYERSETALALVVENRYRPITTARGYTAHPFDPTDEARGSDNEQYVHF